MQINTSFANRKTIEARRKYFGIIHTIIDCKQKIKTASIVIVVQGLHASLSLIDPEAVIDDLKLEEALHLEFEVTELSGVRFGLLKACG